MQSRVAGVPARRAWVGPVLMAVVLSVAACQPSQAPASRPSQPSQGNVTSERGPKSLTVAFAVEPTSLVLPAPVRGGGDPGEIELAIHQWLVGYDERGVAHPMLASELPSRDKGTWVIRPDGTMQTTYRLKPNVTWHDGTRLTARDFVLGWRVMSDPDIPTTKAAIAFTSGMT